MVRREGVIKQIKNGKVSLMIPHFEGLEEIKQKNGAECPNNNFAIYESKLQFL